MKRYLRLFLSLSSLSTKRYLENRTNALSGIFSSLTFFIINIFLISIIFDKTTLIEGWSKDEALLLLGAFRTISALFSLLCLHGINLIPRAIRLGELDLLLVKPIDSQFYLTFRATRIWEFLSAIGGVVLMIYALNKSEVNLTAFSIAVLIFNLILGLLILYGLYFSISTISIWVQRFASLPELYDIITTPLSYPIDILGKNLGLILTFIIPLGFIVTVPTKIFLGKISLYYLGLELIFASLILGFSIWFWNFALKHYTSASS